MIQMKITGRFLILVLMMLVCSCEKEHLFDCMKSTGPMTSETRSVADFTRINVYNNPEVIITQDLVNSVVVEAGEHIISGITTEINNGILTIRNENKCNWVRSYSKTIAVYVHVRKLDMINHYGSSTISSANTLENQNFDLNTWNTGDIQLALKADSIYSRQHVTVGDITLTGESRYCFIYNNGSGFTYESNLEVDDGIVIQRGTGDCQVHVNHALEVEIHSTGNVYYSGNATIHKNTITGTGKLIHQ